MSTLVVDASVAAKLFVEEDLSEAALSVLDARNHLHAPDFLFLEMDNVICKWVRRGIITESEGSDTRTAIRRIPIKGHSFVSLQDSAYYIANQTKRSVYDCLYVALAVFIGGQMVTADRRLYEGLVNGPFGEHVMWVEDIGESKKMV